MNDTIGGERSGRWGILGRVILFLIGDAVMLAAFAPLLSRFRGMSLVLALGVGTSIAAFGLTLLFVRWDRVNLKDVGAEPVWGSLTRFAVGFLAGLVMVGIVSLISVAAGDVRWVREPAIGLGGAAVAFFAFVALACREELGFRGYPLRRLERGFGVWGAQIIVAIVFAAEHWVGGWPWRNALLGAGVGSLAFGMAAIATRGLAVPIGLHAAWNFGDWMMGGKEWSGIWKAAIQLGHENRVERVRTIGYLIVMGFVTVAFWVGYRGRKIPGEQVPQALDN